MGYLNEQKYTRANALANALDERLLFEQHPGIAGDQPVSRDPNWHTQSLRVGRLLGALAWAVAPTTDHPPAAALLDELPAGLVTNLRRRQRAGEPIAFCLQRASNDLTMGSGRLTEQDTPLIAEIARSAEGEAADALRRLAEI
jgi:hypothetical protein